MPLRVMYIVQFNAILALLWINFLVGEKIYPTKNVLVHYWTRTIYIVVPPYFTAGLRLTASLSCIYSLSTLTGASRHSLHVLVPRIFFPASFFLYVSLSCMTLDFGVQLGDVFVVSSFARLSPAGCSLCGCIHHYFFPSLPLNIGYIFFTFCYAN